MGSMGDKKATQRWLFLATADSALRSAQVKAVAKLKFDESATHNIVRTLAL